VAAVEAGGGFVDPGLAADLPATRPGPMTCTAVFPDSAGPTGDDVMVALIFTGPDQRTYWAERIYG
jgi:hypothetical protein